MLGWAARLFNKFMDDRALSLASLLAWGMLNTFLPLLLGILSIVGLVLGDSAFARAVEQRIFDMLPASASGLLRDSLAAFQQAAGTAGLISLGFLLFNGSNFFVSLESVFDLAYHVPERHIVTQRIVSFVALFVTTGLLLVITGAAILSSGFGQRAAAVLPDLVPVLDVDTGPLISIVGLAATLVLLYWLIPNNRHSIRHALPGAAVACLVLVLVGQFFPLYIELFGQGFTLYAAFGIVLLFMLWLYVVGVVLVGGAVLNAFLENPDAATAKSAFAARALTGQTEVPGTFMSRR